MPQMIRGQGIGENGFGVRDAEVKERRKISHSNGSLIKLVTKSRFGEAFMGLVLVGFIYKLSPDSPSYWNLLKNVHSHAEVLRLDPSYSSQKLKEKLKYGCR